MKKITFILTILILILCPSVFASGDITVKYNESKIQFEIPPIVEGEETLVQLRPFADALGLSVEYAKKNIKVSNADISVIFTENSDKITVNGKISTMPIETKMYNGSAFVPLKEVAAYFADEIVYVGEERTVYITGSLKKQRMVIENAAKIADFTYFYQSQPALEFENNGRGYCWVCSYAMLMSDVTGDFITPRDVADVNISRGYNGNFMSGHESLVAEFGCKLVPALLEESPYFGGFNTKNRGETTLLIESDEDAKKAICEALDNNPKGVIVRYEGYPHSMVAVDYDDENIYFNDPGLAQGEHITFENTSLKGFKLSDISYIQAIVKK